MLSRSIEPAMRDVRTLFVAGAAGGLPDGELLRRFLGADRDAAEAAFSVLIGRHGPAIRGICRGVLRDPHDAEDALQATFLILARKAGSIHRRESIGPWLRGVARRVAVRAKGQAVRHRRQLRRHAAEVGTCRPPDDGMADDLDVLREELGRLPAELRHPLELCYLRGLTYAAAARTLGLTEATIRGRLARARDALRPRLARRGLGAFALGPSPVPIPPMARAAIRFAAGEHPARVASTSAIALAEGALKTMRLIQLATVGSAAFAACALGLGTALHARPGPSADEAPAAKAEPAKAPEPAGPIDPDLARAVGHPIVRSQPVTKDCMILAYLSDWSHGDVDNLGVADNDGGVRTLVDWGTIPDSEAQRDDRRFLLALYARKVDDRYREAALVSLNVDQRLRPSSILAFETDGDWPERTSWKTQPGYFRTPSAEFDFVRGVGWKLFDVTPVIRLRAVEQRRGQGLSLRFLNEYRPGAWTGYQFVGREGVGEWANRRPQLLVVDMDAPDRQARRPAAAR